MNIDVLKNHLKDAELEVFKEKMFKSDLVSKTICAALEELANFRHWDDAHRIKAKHLVGSNLHADEAGQTCAKAFSAIPAGTAVLLDVQGVRSSILISSFMTSFMRYFNENNLPDHFDAAMKILFLADEDFQVKNLEHWRKKFCQFVSGTTQHSVASSS